MASLASKLSTANENTWIRLGAISELMHDVEKAMYSYENVLRHNPYNVKALTQIASICRLREQYPKAVEYFQRILNVENNNGEIWGALGHCYLMMDDLQKAYTAYQQALYHLPNPKDPNLWYGIGILYDRYGSFEHAEEAFTAVLKMDAKFEKANEIYFRLGIIYKQQLKYDQALDCFRYILQKPPRPLTQGDIWFQIGHVYEIQKDFNAAKDAYERVLKESPNHAKALQQLGWLYHSNAAMGNQDIAINYLMRSIDADPSDGQTWYLLGRCYMAQQQYRKAYDAYQQAVYRDGRNPTFWCSIGVLYYQINQYRDALDAYSRAIRLNPYLSEVWYDLGTLYESCNQISDSLDAYQRAAELDPGNKHIQQRLAALRESHNNPSKPVQSEASIERKETPTTLEPRASHLQTSESQPPRSPKMASNIPAVADLVDVGSDHKRTLLPPTDVLNAPPTPPPTKPKEEAKPGDPGQIQWIVAERDGNKDKEKEKERDKEREKEKEQGEDKNAENNNSSNTEYSSNINSGTSPSTPMEIEGNVSIPEEKDAKEKANGNAMEVENAEKLEKRRDAETDTTPEKTDVTEHSSEPETEKTQRHEEKEENEETSSKSNGGTKQEQNQAASPPTSPGATSPSSGSNESNLKSEAESGSESKVEVNNGKSETADRSDKTDRTTKRQKEDEESEESNNEHVREEDGNSSNTDGGSRKKSGRDKKRKTDK